MVISKSAQFELSKEAKRELYSRGSKAVVGVTEKEYTRLTEICSSYNPIYVDGLVIIENKNSEYRADLELIKLIEEWGTERVGGPYNYLKIVSIPDNMSWQIDMYDGGECIAEKHRTWC